MFCRSVFCIFVLLSIFSFHSEGRRDLEQLRVNWSERDGFSLLSDLLDITVNDGDVSIDSSIGSLHVDNGEVVIDSQVLRLDTRQNIIVEVDNGNVLELVSTDTGVVDLSVGEDGELARVLVVPREDATVREESILVDFSEDGELVTVAVGENGEIVDVVVPNGTVTISRDRTIAKMNLVETEVNIRITDEDRDSIQTKRQNMDSSEHSDGVSFVQVTGSSVVSSSSETSI